MDNARVQPIERNIRNVSAGSQTLLGILGGLGPLASAEFMKTIYEENPFDVEQKAPACLLLSDPNVPDRTTAILRGEEQQVVDWLEGALTRLRGLGAHRVVIACITMHHFLASVPAPLRDMAVSLVELTLDEVLASGRRWLLLTSMGTRRAGVFERNARWSAAAPQLVWPNPSHQAELHEAIYRLKKHGEVAKAADLCERLVDSELYGVDGFIAGCTELHLVTKYLRNRPPQEQPRTLDPLTLVASRISTLGARPLGRVLGA